MNINIKSIIKQTGTTLGLAGVLVGGSVAYAAATIPAACSTPGTCTDITSTFQAVASKTKMQFLGSNGTNFVALQAPAGQAADITLTLPATAGNDGEVLKTDGNGILSWVGGAVAENMEDLILTKDAWAGSSNGTLLNGETWTTIKAKYKAIRISGFSPRYANEDLTWGETLSTDLIKAGSNFQFVTDNGIARFKITNLTDTTLFNNSTAMDTSQVRIHGIKAQKTIIKPTTATVPTGFEIVLIEGTTGALDSDIDISGYIPAGKRVIGISSALVKFGTGWVTSDTVGTVDFQVYISSPTNLRIQGMTSSLPNSPYMITLQLANN